MRKLLLLSAALIAATCVASPAQAQDWRTTATCGTITFPTRLPGAVPYITADQNGNLCTSVSVSASVTGFTPSATGARATPLTVTTSDSSGTLPNGAAVIITNVGTTNPMYCNVSGIAATVADQLVTANGGWIAFTVPAAVTTLHCIATGGSTTANIVGGSGLPTGTGGGSGGGGSSAITTWAGGTLGAMANYGTSPGAVLVPGVNAFITNTITANLGTLNGAATATNQTGGGQKTQVVDGSGNVISSTTNWLDVNVKNATAPGQATPQNSSPVVQAGMAYETVAAGVTAQSLGATGGTGDYLSHCVVYPTTTTPGVVTVFDNTSSATNNAIAFPGGASSVSNLVPFSVPVGAFSVNGAWKVTTGANLVVTCYGRFT